MRSLNKNLKNRSRPQREQPCLRGGRVLLTGLIVVVISLVLGFCFDEQVSAAASWIIGKFNKAYDFDGDYYVNVGDISENVQAVSFWVNGTAAGKIVSLNASAYISAVGGTISATGFDTPVIYVDGVVSSTIDSNWHYVVVTSNTGISASAVQFGSVALNYLAGALDDVKMYNYALSAREIAEKYRQGSPSLAQGGTVTNDVYVMNSGKMGVGTVGPNTLLNVSGTSVANYGQLSIDAGAAADAIMTFYTDAYKAYIQYDDDVDDFIIQNQNAGSFGDLLLNPLGGSIGIGTTVPGKLLDVDGDTYIRDDFYVGSTTELVTNAGFIMDGDDAYIHDLLGVGDTIYAENNVIVGNTTTIGTDSMAFSGAGTIQYADGSVFTIQDGGSNAILITDATNNLILGDTLATSTVQSSDWGITDTGVISNISGYTQTDGAFSHTGTTSALDLTSTINWDTDSTFTLGSTRFIYTSDLAAGNTTTEAISIKSSVDLGVADELFQIGDGGADFMTFLGSGNVGIGTTVPGALLDVRGDTGMHLGAGQDLQLTVSSDDIYFKQATADKDIYFNINDSDGGGDTTVLFLDGSTSRIGIGTTVPGGKLDVYASSGTFFDVQDDGTSTFTVTDTQITSAIPHSFTSAGDVSLAYDLLFTNQTASYIKSNAPLYIEAGEPFESNDLILRTYNNGDIVFDTASNLVFGGHLLPDTDDTYDLGSNTARWRDLYLGPGTLHIGTSATDEYAISYDTAANRLEFNVNGSGAAEIVMDSSGYVGIGTTAPSAKLDVKSIQTSGTLGLFGAPSSVTLAGALTGISIDLSANYTATGYGVTGQSIALPAVTNTGAGTYAYKGLTVTGGALIQNTAAGTNTWAGLDITMPNITQTTGTVTSTGLKITGGTVTSGTSYGLIVDSNAGNVGIGTTVPASLTELYDTDANPILTLTAAHATDYDPQIKFRTDASPTVKFSMGLDGTDDKFRIFSGDGVGGTSEFVIDANGSTGIGTATPGATLDIYASSGTFFDVQDDGTSTFTVTDTQITSAIPHSFTSAGDVSLAYDLLFTNQTASYIKSNAPLYLEAGESFESNDLTFKTYNNGDVVIDSPGGVTLIQAQAWDLAGGSTTALNIESGLMNFDTTNSRVGIGLTNPTETLHIDGSLCVTSDGVCGVDIVAGEIGAEAVLNVGADLAEIYPSSEELEPGEVVAVAGPENIEEIIITPEELQEIEAKAVEKALTEVEREIGAREIKEILQQNLESEIINLELQMEEETQKDAGENIDFSLTTENISKLPVEMQEKINQKILLQKEAFTRTLKEEKKRDFGVERTISAYQNDIMGVVSTRPGMTLGVSEYSGYKIALVGRTSVKVNLENGPVEPGDYLTSSSVPGIAMKAAWPGRTIGLALEGFDGAKETCSPDNLNDCHEETSEIGETSETLETLETGDVLTFVNVGFSLGALDENGQVTGVEPLEIAGQEDQGLAEQVSDTLSRFTVAVKHSFEELGMAIEDGIVSIKKLFVKEVEIGTPEQPSGMTIYDQVTRQPYCVFMANGEMRELPGRCENIDFPNIDLDVSQPVPEFLPELPVEPGPEVPGVEPLEIPAEPVIGPEVPQAPEAPEGPEPTGEEIPVSPEIPETPDDSDTLFEPEAELELAAEPVLDPETPVAEPAAEVPTEPAPAPEAPAPELPTE